MNLFLWYTQRFRGLRFQKGLDIRAHECCPKSWRGLRLWWRQLVSKCIKPILRLSCLRSLQRMVKSPSLKNIWERMDMTASLKLIRKPLYGGVGGKSLIWKTFTLHSMLCTRALEVSTSKIYETEIAWVLLQRSTRNTEIVAPAYLSVYQIRHLLSSVLAEDTEVSICQKDLGPREHDCCSKTSERALACLCQREESYL